MIRLADEPDIDVNLIIDGLERIEGAIEQADIGEIVASMQELIHGFTPSWGIENPTINAAKQASVPFVLIKNNFNEKLVKKFKGRIINNLIGLS